MLRDTLLLRFLQFFPKLSISSHLSRFRTLCLWIPLQSSKRAIIHKVPHRQHTQTLYLLGLLSEQSQQRPICKSIILSYQQSAVDWIPHPSIAKLLSRQQKSGWDKSRDQWVKWLPIKPSGIPGTLSPTHNFYRV